MLCIHEDYYVVDRSTDLARDPDTGKWYLQQVRGEPDFLTRTSAIAYDHRQEARAHYQRGLVRWGPWE